MGTMTATIPDRPLVADEFLALELPEDARYELIEGEVVVQALPLLRHQLATEALLAALRAWWRAAPGRGFAVGPIDTWIDAHNVVGPDAQWYAAGRELGSPDRRPQPLGDIVVEARSPSTWHRDLGIKRRLYEQHGAREYWLLDVEARSAIVLGRSAPDAETFDDGAELMEGEELSSPLLPGFSVPVAEIFADPTAR